MSASERLRALEPPRSIFPEGRWVDFGGKYVNVDAAIALTDALPLIADVVEAQERFLAERDGPGGEFAPFDDTEAFMRSSDAALREHLEGGDRGVCTCTPGEGFGWEGRSTNLKGPHHERDCPLFSTGQEAARMEHLEGGDE